MGAFLFVLYEVGQTSCDRFMGTDYDLNLEIFDLEELLSWLGSIAIIAGFFWVQVQIDQLGKGLPQTILFLLSMMGEVYLIWLWNSRDI